jgi:hypothetical protein
LSAPNRLALRVITGDGAPSTIPPGHIVYTWAGDGRTNAGAAPGALRAALEDARDELLAIRPDGVCVHGAPSQLLSRGDDGLTAIEWCAPEIRALLPGVRIWVGVGGDGWIGQLRAGKATRAQVMQPLQRVAALARQLGAESIVWNFESQWKHASGDKLTLADLDAFSRELMESLCALAPKCAHIVSSFDHVGFHMAMPWAALLDGNVTGFTAQNYVAVAGDSAPRGLLQARIVKASKSQDAARAQGKFPADERGTDGVDTSHNDVDVFSTVQLHGTDEIDLANALVNASVIQSWSVPLVREGGRADARGVRAAQVARVIRNAVGPGDGAIARFQAASGGALKADGVLGPKTFAFALARATG